MQSTQKGADGYTTDFRGKGCDTIDFQPVLSRNSFLPATKYNTRTTWSQLYMYWCLLYTRQDKVC